MIYKPQKIDAMWDTWLYCHEGTYYLYYLTMGPTPRQGMHGQGVAMATSEDGAHWNEIGVVMPKDEGATGLGTGSVWKSADFDESGKFIMNYSTWFDWCIESQEIRFAESTDLIHWRKLGAECAFRADARWYETYPECKRARWDCIYSIPRPGGGRFGYWTAIPKGRPGFGLGETLDGAHWRALEPPIVENETQGECGAIEKIGDRFVMLYHGGNGTLIADKPQGPFFPAKKNRVLLGGHAYFTRFLPTPSGLLVNHHSFPRTGYGSPCYFAPLKRALVDAEGTVRLGYWEGNEALKGNRIEIEARDETHDDASRISSSITRLDAEQGTVIEGVLNVPPSADDRRTGLCIECRDGRNAAILVGAGGVTEFGAVQGDGTDFKQEFRVDREAPFGATARFRLLLRHALLEFYLDETLILCYSLPTDPTGGFGCVPNTLRPGTALSAWRMSLP